MRSLPALLTSFVLLAAPSTAAAKIGDASDYEFGTVARTATLTSLQSDVAPTGAQRVTSVVVRQDLESRRLSATATYAEPPTAAADSVLYVFVGTSSSANGCVPEMAIAGAGAAAPTAGQFMVDGVTTPIAVTRSAVGTTLTLTSAAHDNIRANDWDCAVANVSSPDSATRYQQFRWVDLALEQVPVFSLDAGRATQGSYAGAWTNVDVEIRNSGRVDANNVRITATGPGMRIRPAARSLATVGDRSTEYGIKFRVKLTSAKARTLTIRATAPGARPYVTRVQIVRKPRPAVPASLVGRVYWGSERSSISDSSGWRNHGVHFVSKRFAYLGFSARGALPTCRRTTKECRPYSYAARSGVLRLQGKRVKVNSEGFTMRTGKHASTEVRFSPVTLPARGTRFSTDLIRNDWNGNCLLSCTSTSERIAFDRAGRFLKTRSSIGSWPGLGSSWAIAPPDARGTWRIISKGRIEMKFATGTVERRVIAFEQDLRGRPSPAGEGLLLDGTNYYPR